MAFIGFTELAGLGCLEPADYIMLLRTLDRVFGLESVTAKRLYDTFRYTGDREFRRRVLMVVRMNRESFGEVSDETFDYMQHAMLCNVLRDYDLGWYFLSNTL